MGVKVSPRIYWPMSYVSDLKQTQPCVYWLALWIDMWRNLCRALRSGGF